MSQQVLDFENPEHLERVTSRIGRAITQFCRDRIKLASEFRAEELRQYIDQTVGVTAPGSADRILRDLRARGVLDYRVVSRRNSLYEVLEVSEEG